MKNTRLIYEDDEKLPSGKDIESNSSSSESDNKTSEEQTKDTENKVDVTEKQNKEENKESSEEPSKDTENKEQNKDTENKEELKPSEGNTNIAEDLTKKSVNALTALKFKQNSDNSFEKIIKDRFVVKISGIENKTATESKFHSSLLKIICEAKEGIPVKIEITDKKTGETKIGNATFNGDKQAIVKIIKQHIYDKFLRNKKDKNSEGASSSTEKTGDNEKLRQLITSALGKLDDNELNAFEFFYGKKIEKFLTN